MYACKAEHESELSFIAGTIFENGESGFDLWPREGISKSSNHPNYFLFCSFVSSEFLWLQKQPSMRLLADTYSKVGSGGARTLARASFRSEFALSCIDIEAVKGDTCNPRTWSEWPLEPSAENLFRVISPPSCAPLRSPCASLCFQFTPPGSPGGWRGLWTAGQD